jgi:hypothetical protein
MARPARDQNLEPLCEHLRGLAGEACFFLVEAAKWEECRAWLDLHRAEFAAVSLPPHGCQVFALAAPPLALVTALQISRYQAATVANMLPTLCRNSRDDSQLLLSEGWAAVLTG